MRLLLRTRTGLRRFTLALASAQLLAYAAAPALEAWSGRSPGAVAVERAHSRSCVPIHRPDACLACQLLTSHSRRPEPARVPIPAAAASEPPRAEGPRAATRAPLRCSPIRAPPSSVA